MKPLTEAQRRALDLSTNVAVTAGAGSGKTTVLVERYVRTIESAEPGALLSPGRILAITYTRRSAADLRLRIAESIERRAERDPRWAPLLDELAGAPIGTIHSFCSSVLREHAVAAKVDPAFVVLEEEEGRALVRETIADLLAERARAGGPDVEVLAAAWRREEIARLLDLLAGRRALARRWALETAGASPAALLARWSEYAPLDLAALLEKGPELCAIEAAACAGPDDDDLARAARAFLSARAGVLAEQDPRRRRALFRRLPREAELLDSTGKPRSFERCGSAARWGAARALLAPARKALSAAARRLAGPAATAIADLDEAALPPLQALARLALDFFGRLDARKARRAALDFDDLVERTAALFRDPAGAAARAALRERFRAILVDEFQDVDPLQWEVIEALSTDDAGRLLPRRLFVVGDEKQSIYRFRGADVSVFGEVRARIVEEGGRLVPLDDNFRALPAPLEAVNALFERIFAGAREDFEACAAALAGRRVPAPDEGRGRVELVLRPARERRNGGEGGGGGFDDSLEEAEIVAKLVRRTLDSPDERVFPEGGPPRRIGPGDIAILLRRRKNLSLFETALRRRGVPFSVHGGIGFYGAPEVLDAASLLAFLADPRRDAALAAVLRSPLGALSDGAIYMAAQAGPPETPLLERLRAAAAAGSLPEGDRGPARAVLALLDRLLAVADRTPVAETLRRAFEGSGAYAALAVGLRGRQALANLEKLLDLVRENEQRGFRGLARIAAALETSIEEEAREAEAEVLPREGSGPADAVRILTVHAAKGLEFPVVIVPEIGAPPPGESGPLLFEELGRRDARGRRIYEAGIRVPDPAAGFSDADTGLRRLLHARARAKAAAESRRLFYVACTRARDRLVLVGTGAPDTAPEGSWLRLLAEAPEVRLETIDPAHLSDPGPPEGGAASGPRAIDALRRGPPIEPAPPRPLSAPPGTAVLSPSKWRVFEACPRKFYYDAVLRIPEWPEAEAAAAGGAVKGGETEDASAARGRLRGIVLHALLEEKRPLPPDEVDGAVARALAELGSDDPELAAAIASAARAALAAVESSEVGRFLRAAREVRREVPFTWRRARGGAVVEGRIDVLARDGDRTVIVDWKTDEVAACEAEEVARARGYGAQIALYALATARILGVERVETVLFFTSPGAALREEWDAARLAGVEARLARDLDAIARGAFDRSPEAPCASCGFARSGICDVADRPQEPGPAGRGSR